MRTTYPHRGTISEASGLLAELAAKRRGDFVRHLYGLDTDGVLRLAAYHPLLQPWVSASGYEAVFSPSRSGGLVSVEGPEIVVRDA